MEFLEPHIIINYPVEPSDGIYFGSYPYHVKFARPVPEELLQRRHDGKLITLHNVPQAIINANRTYLNAEIRSFCAINDIDNRCSQGNNFFFKNVYELEQVLVEFEDAIELVKGPLDAEHLDILLDPNYTTSQGKPYYKKYEYKLSFDGLWRTGGSSTRFEQLKDLRESVERQLPEDYRVRNEGYAISYFFNEDDILSLYAMIKLTMKVDSDIGVRIDRRIS